MKTDRATFYVRLILLVVVIDAIAFYLGLLFLPGSVQKALLLLLFFVASLILAIEVIVKYEIKRKALKDNLINKQ
jgi:hypothetical protein